MGLANNELCRGCGHHSRIHGTKGCLQMVRSGLTQVGEIKRQVCPCPEYLPQEWKDLIEELERTDP